MSDTIRPRQLLALKDRVVARFNAGNWREIGILTDCPEIVDNHHRLLRSLSFSDDDYEGNALEVLRAITLRDEANHAEVLRYLDKRYPEEGGLNISSVDTPSAPRVYFQPSVFTVPDEQVDPNLLSVMMPFDASFRGVYLAISTAALVHSMRCQRADDIWVHSAVIQDVFSLILRSFIVVCDFTDKNPNVFYEAGIAHTLGKHVIPITQNPDHIPFDLRHHRYLRYLNNCEGLDRLRHDIGSRIAQLLMQR